MGWTVHYAVIVPGELEASDTSMLASHLDGWTRRLTEGCESMRLQAVPYHEQAEEPLSRTTYRHVEILTGRYRDGTSGIEFVPGQCDPSFTYLWGFTKIQYGKDPEADFCTVVEALRTLAQARPQWKILVSDDFEVIDHRVDIRTVDPRALLDEDDEDDEDDD